MIAAATRHAVERKLLKVRTLEFRDESIQRLVFRGAIGCGGMRDELRDEET
jgi:hypothetical protein